MRKLLFMFALVPQFAFSGSILLTITADQGLSKLKLPGEIFFESTNVFCEERGLTPQPWAAPRKEKLAPKIVSLNGNSVVLEITTDPAKQDICKYKFSGFTVWSERSDIFVSLETLNKNNSQSKDIADLEVSANQNSLFSVECISKKNYSRQCSILKDGVKKGYSAGNGSRLYVDMNKLEAQKEISVQVEYKSFTE